MAKKKYIIEFDAETGKFTQGVEEVNQGLKKTNEETAELSDSFEVLGDKADQFTGGMVSGMSNGLKGVKKMIGGMKGLKAAIAATGVGLLVVALGAMVNWMRTSEKGANTLRKAQLGLNVVWKEASDTVNDMVEGDFSAFTTSLENMWNAIQQVGLIIKNSFLIQLKQMELLSLKARSGLNELFGRDNSELQERIKETTLEVVELNKEIGVAAIKAIAPYAKELTELVGKYKDASDKAEKMLQTELSLIEARKRLLVSSAELQKTIDLEQKKIDDTTRSYEDRSEALDKQSAAQVELAKNVAELARLEEMALRQQINYTTGVEERRELEQQLAEVQASRIEAETRVGLVELENAQKRREIDREEVERKRAIFEMTRDLALESEAEGLAQLEAEIDAREEAALRELELLHATEEQKQEARDSFNAIRLQQIKEFNTEQEKEQKETNDKLVAEQKAADEAILASKIGAANATAALFGELAGLAEEGSALAKVAALADIGANTATGFIQGLTLAQKAALEGPPGIRPFVFATFFASQIAAVTKAAKTAKGILSGGGASASAPSASAPSVGGGGGGSAPADAVPAVDFSFLETGANQTAVQAYVVEQNVSNSQQANQLIQDQASL